MTGNPNTMDCREFQSQMADLIGSGADAANHPHLKTCPRCRALLTDLETIAEAARQLLPVEPPEDRLWERIESAIKREENPSNRG